MIRRGDIHMYVKSEHYHFKTKLMLSDCMQEGARGATKATWQTISYKTI